MLLKKANLWDYQTSSKTGKYGMMHFKPWESLTADKNYYIQKSYPLKIDEEINTFQDKNTLKKFIGGIQDGD
jgi:hypothetical protein